MSWKFRGVWELGTIQWVNTFAAAVVFFLRRKTVDFRSFNYAQRILRAMASIGTRDRSVYVSFLTTHTHEREDARKFERLLALSKVMLFRLCWI